MIKPKYTKEQLELMLECYKEVLDTLHSPINYEEAIESLDRRTDGIIDEITHYEDYYG